MLSAWIVVSQPAFWALCAFLVAVWCSKVAPWQLTGLVLLAGVCVLGATLRHSPVQQDVTIVNTPSLAAPAARLVFPSLYHLPCKQPQLQDRSPVALGAGDLVLPYTEERGLTVQGKTVTRLSCGQYGPWARPMLWTTCDGYVCRVGDTHMVGVCHQ